MEVDESINNDESQQRNVYGSLIDGVHTTRRTNVSVAAVRVRIALESRVEVDTPVAGCSCIKRTTLTNIQAAKILIFQTSLFATGKQDNARKAM